MMNLQEKLKEQIAKQKHREKISKIQAVKIRNQEKQRIKDEELKIKKKEYYLRGLREFYWMLIMALTLL